MCPWPLGVDIGLCDVVSRDQLTRVAVNEAFAVQAVGREIIVNRCQYAAHGTTLAVNYHFYGRNRD
jgi:hypothetical protein